MRFVVHVPKLTPPHALAQELQNSPPRFNRGLVHARPCAGGEITRLSRRAEHSVRHWRTATTLGLIAIACVFGVWSQAEHWRPATYLARASDAVWRLVGLPIQISNLSQQSCYMVSQTIGISRFGDDFYHFSGNSGCLSGGHV
jgi:hypothetical protein